MAEPVRIALVSIACAALAACQASAPRRAQPDAPIPAETASVREPGIAMVEQTHPPATKARRRQQDTPNHDVTPGSESQADVWQRLRDSFALPGCDYTPGVQHWVRRYAGSPRRFAGQLATMLPALDYTQRRLASASIPGEFALLPIVESHYHPFPGAHSRPAGMWQMIASTARSAGLRVDAWFDGRLNLAASTSAATMLLDRYAEQFDEDWRLVAFAYNAGEYRIRQLLEKHQPSADAASLQAMGLPRTSLEYLDKLLALSCLVREPERFDLTLPTLEPGEELVELPLEGTVGVTLARALSGLSREQFDRVNNGLLKGRTPPGDTLVLLLPADRVDDARTALAGIPPARRLDWRRQSVPSVEALDSIADQYGLDTRTLLALNGVADDSTAEGGHWWLPGAGEDGHAAGATTARDSDIHVVRSGDSLWSIARRHGLTVAELLRYNRLDKTHLRPGQRLRLTAP